jgi:hypothetical protein
MFVVVAVSVMGGVGGVDIDSDTSIKALSVVIIICCLLMIITIAIRVVVIVVVVVVVGVVVAEGSGVITIRRRAPIRFFVPLDKGIIPPVDKVLSLLMIRLQEQQLHVIRHERLAVGLHAMRSQTFRALFIGGKDPLSPAGGAEVMVTVQR